MQWSFRYHRVHHIASVRSADEQCSTESTKIATPAATETRSDVDCETDSEYEVIKEEEEEEDS